MQSSKSKITWLFIASLLIVGIFTACSHYEVADNLSDTSTSDQQTKTDTDPSTWLKVDYGLFTVWVDCDKRSAMRFAYVATKDVGTLARVHNFTFEPSLPPHCRQLSNATYKENNHRYDRGHMVPANHLDHDAGAIKASNNMLNILPQQANMNRGAWYKTEVIIECRRDLSPIEVFGGPIYAYPGVDVNELFVESHGLVTPSAFWKVIIQDGESMAWIIPNHKKATYKNLQYFEVSLSEIRKVTGEEFSAPINKRLNAIPRNCDLS